MLTLSVHQVPSGAVRRPEDDATSHPPEIGAEEVVRLLPPRRRSTARRPPLSGSCPETCRSRPALAGRDHARHAIGIGDVEEDVMNYRVAYRIGFHPWEDAATDPPFVEKISELFDREEKGRQPPFGPALDLGTGSGLWGIELAKRGWQVTGIDIVDTALRRARERVKKAGVEMRLVHGDVTALRAAGVGSGFRLVLDTGTFHDFNSRQREAMGREVSAVAAPDATVLLLAWPKRWRPLIRGVSRREIEAAFPDWKVISVEPSHFRLPALLEWVLRPDEHWYRLRRE